MKNKVVMVLEDDRMAMEYLKVLAKKYFANDTLFFVYSMAELLATVKEVARVDVLISDLSLPDSYPLQTIKILQRLRSDNPSLKIVVSSQLTEEYLVPEMACLIGVAALYHKQLDTSKLEHYLSTIDNVKPMGCEVEVEDINRARNLLELSNKKHHILECLCRGLSISEIAHKTSRTYNSVHNHIQEIKSSVSDYKNLQHLFG